MWRALEGGRRDASTTRRLLVGLPGWVANIADFLGVCAREMRRGRFVGHLDAAC